MWSLVFRYLKEEKEVETTRKGDERFVRRDRRKLRHSKELLYMHIILKTKWE